MYLIVGVCSQVGKGVWEGMKKSEPGEEEERLQQSHKITVTTLVLRGNDCPPFLLRYSLLSD